MTKTKLNTTLATTIALLGFAAAPALADTMVQDVDANGSFSMEELVEAYPDLTPEVFGEIDADQSGEVSQDELTAAIDAGVIAG
ncbi:EF-hand domain-containing protein [Pseudooceanicola onchidii]|uniref:EF-hand domain-containing protein n=1 Tax=Pseudooceanicola onchidii TaxID=2562279 RepID=UPI0010AA54BF|nr:EF-hand domain-containing protein [Pseudooceanicola onchidii]